MLKNSGSAKYANAHASPKETRKFKMRGVNIGPLLCLTGNLDVHHLLNIDHMHRRRDARYARGLINDFVRKPLRAGYVLD
jgi:hypothetical protein